MGALIFKFNCNKSENLRPNNFSNGVTIGSLPISESRSGIGFVTVVHKTSIEARNKYICR
jgi:hypothetical protein